jgi:hypothetical protein
VVSIYCAWARAHKHRGDRGLMPCARQRRCHHGGRPVTATHGRPACCALRS